MKMKGYRKEKTTMGRRIRVKMSRQEIIERRIFHGLLVAMPIGLCWLCAWAGGMLR